MRFAGLKKTRATIVGSDGAVRAETDAIFAGDIIIITDAKIPIEVGDEIRRKLPNGLEEVSPVTDVNFFDTKIAGLGPHYQIKFAKKGQLPAGTGGNYFNVTGANARVNFGSIDNSTNIVSEQHVFSNLRLAIEKGVADSKERIAILDALARLEKIANDDSGKRSSSDYGAAYQNFITSAANHMTLIAPFIPALSKLL